MGGAAAKEKPKKDQRLCPISNLYVYLFNFIGNIQITMTSRLILNHALTVKNLQRPQSQS